VPLGISAFWQIVKLLNSQNYFFSFQGMPINRIVGAKNKIKTIVDIFFLLLISNFSFFFFLSSLPQFVNDAELVI